MELEGEWASVILLHFSSVTGRSKIKQDKEVDCNIE